MKVNVTKRQVREDNYKILSIGYCEAQYLLRGVNPQTYCCGVYGWSCDNYEITTEKHHLLISTGYSPVSTQNFNITPTRKYEIIKKYEDKARQINCKFYKWDDIKKRLDKNLEKFINEIYEESEKENNEK